MDGQDGPPDQQEKGEVSAPPGIPQGDNGRESRPATTEQLAEVQNEMNAFERSTVRLARMALLISLLAAFFVYLQWQEMNNQTEIAANAFQKSVVDSNQSDANTRQQLEIAKGQAKTAADALKASENSFLTTLNEMKRQSDAMKDAATATEKSADADVAANRAWMVPDGKVVNVIAPIEFYWKNVGKSPAVDIQYTAEYRPYLTAGPDFMSGCDNLLKNHGWITRAGNVLPDATLLIDLNGGLPDQWISPTGNLGTLQIHGCVWYIDVLTDKTRSTEFCYSAIKAPTQGQIFGLAPCYGPPRHLLFN